MNMNPNIMVCVTRQKTCERLINIGREIAKKTDGNLHVVHAVKNGTNFFDDPHEGEALEHLFQISKHAGANMSVLRSGNVIGTLIEFAQSNEIDIAVLGAPPKSKHASGIVFELERSLPDVEFHVIEG